jgi:gamma-glutamylcyclotransferase (GGCT)/AIG2-like uncharacterized protein YtfP
MKLMISYLLLGIVIGLILTVVFFWVNSASKTDRTETLFVYGTLENPIIRSVMCRCVTVASNATLTDYRQAGLNIIPSPGELVTGELIRLSPQELSRLDRYEDVPNNYIRKAVEIDGDTVWVYLQPN